MMVKTLLSPFDNAAPAPQQHKSNKFSSCCCQKIVLLIVLVSYLKLCKLLLATFTQVPFPVILSLMVIYVLVLPCTSEYNGYIPPN